MAASEIHLLIKHFNALTVAQKIVPLQALARTKCARFFATRLRCSVHDVNIGRGFPQAPAFGGGRGALTPRHAAASD